MSDTCRYDIAQNGRYRTISLTLRVILYIPDGGSVINGAYPVYFHNIKRFVCLFLYLCVYPHWSRDSVSPVCEIFFLLHVILWDLKTAIFRVGQQNWLYFDVANIWMHFYHCKCRIFNWIEIIYVYIYCFAFSLTK